jgi:hypothetical protein
LKTCDCLLAEAGKRLFDPLEFLLDQGKEHVRLLLSKAVLGTDTACT